MGGGGGGGAEKELKIVSKLMWGREETSRQCWPQGAADLLLEGYLAGSKVSSGGAGKAHTKSGEKRRK